MTSQGFDSWDFTRKIPNVFFTAICGSILMTSIFLQGAGDGGFQPEPDFLPPAPADL